MGIKGRDVALWVAPVIFILTAIFRGWELAIMDILIAILFAYQGFYELPRARKLEYMTLLPINRYWARLLVGRKIKGTWQNAYELHITYKKGVDLADQRNGIYSELLKIKNSMPGLYLWETSTSIPFPIRKLIRELEQEKKAYWAPGCFIPRFPLVYKIAHNRKSKKILRHGAILNV